jgi:hypothetical protein
MRKAKLISVSLLMLASAAVSGENLLPEFTGDWVNGGPYTLNGVKEKVVLIILMERG